MKRVTTLCAVVLALAGVGVAWAGGTGDTWEARLRTARTPVILGEPVYVRLTVKNVSSKPVTMPYKLGAEGRFWHVKVWPEDQSIAKAFYGSLLITTGSPVEVGPDKELYEPGAVVDTGWYELFRAQWRGRYRAVYRCMVPEKGFPPWVDWRTGRVINNEDVWHGAFTSNEVVEDVIEPTGIDLEAYKAFGGHPIGDFDRLGELLSRFPTSTYAAYVVWKKTWPGTRPIKIEDVLYSMQHGPRSFGQLYLPCVAADSPVCRDMGYPPPGEEAARRQAGWIDLVLKHHPDIWFGDELRFKRAYAAYFLGDKPACAAGLEALAEHGRPEVGAKAKDLLAAMRAKGMLPEEGRGD